MHATDKGEIDLLMLCQRTAYDFHLITQGCQNLTINQIIHEFILNLTHKSSIPVAVRIWACK